MTPVVCTIGSTDPWNAAGLGLDLPALAACGVRAVMVVAGVTAQGPGGISALHAVPAAVVSAQLESLAGAGIAAYRIGALLDAATARAVAAHVAAARLPVVYDPVLGASGGGTFAGPETRTALLEEVLPRAALVTPNLAEAASLTGASVVDVESMEAAAIALRARGASAVLVKGGHLDAGDVADVLVDAAGTVVFRAPRLAGTLRGTGCLLACAVAAGLARGDALRDAVANGRAFVRERFAARRILGGMPVAY